MAVLLGEILRGHVRDEMSVPPFLYHYYLSLGWCAGVTEIFFYSFDMRNVNRLRGMSNCVVIAATVDSLHFAASLNLHQEGSGGDY